LEAFLSSRSYYPSGQGAQLVAKKGIKALVPPDTADNQNPEAYRLAEAGLFKCIEKRHLLRVSRSERLRNNGL
jgi:hypothetical protein